MEQSLLELCRKMLDENPNITPADMAHNLHCTGYVAAVVTMSLHKFFSELMVKEAATILLAEYCHPLVGKTVLLEALASAGYDRSSSSVALDEIYPNNTGSYAILLTEDSFVAAPPHTGYSFGVGDFSIEAWIKAETAGTILARKGTEGTYGNGGFLLVLKPDGTVKFATDDGFGFFEINTTPVKAFDGGWHHVLATRTGDSLAIYWDFAMVAAQPRTNRYPRLNVNNSLRLLLGHTDQAPEPYNAYRGCIGEVRIWNISKTYVDRVDWEATDWVTMGLVALWSFSAQSWNDLVAGNMLSPQGTTKFVLRE